MAVETHQNATLIATAAIQRGAPGTFVFLVREDKSVAVTPVKLGTVEGETAEVQSGIASGNLVVVDGADKLRDGSKVELVDPNARAEQAAPSKKGPPNDTAPGGQGRRFKGGG